MNKVKFKLKCTSCRATEDATDEQIEAARKEGVAFSRCCQAVATVEQVSARTTLSLCRKPTTARRR